ncbi:MAG: hypothetical protein ACYSUK_01205 [Planctomycetota bacterium]|jgi:hypothetical protein
MKDLLKNPILYYILIPIVVGSWPLLITTVYLPKSKANWYDMKSQYLEAQITIQEILKLDPDRLKFADSANKNEKFDYATAVEKVASEHSIPPTKYTLRSGAIITTREQTTQNARISIKEVDITKFTQFLSSLQLQPGIQCTNIQLTKQKNAPDSWDIDLEFKYYF